MSFAYLMIQHAPQYRRDAFAEGLRRCGYTVMGAPRLGPVNRDDVLVIWNRYARFNSIAETFEQQGARVIVAENGALGRDAPHGPWYSITETNPLAAGSWPMPPGDYGIERWKQISFALDVRICDWRKGGIEIIILAQRGIGPEGVRQPDGWHRRAAEILVRAGHRVRIREHPGEKTPAVSLEDDLRNALAVVTWASGAAFKALLLGVPVFYGCEQWVGATAANRFTGEVHPLDLTNNYLERLPTFQRLAWSMWQIHEITAGHPFRHLLSGSSGSASTPAVG